MFFNYSFQERKKLSALGAEYSRRSWYLAVAGLGLSLGLVFRLVAINQSLWLDEAISVQAASQYSLRGLMAEFMPTDFNPPLYYFLLHFWLKIFPATEFFVRLPSIIFGILTCWLIYKIYRLIFKDEKGALLSLLLMVSSPLHIYYSQEARAYSLAVFLVTGSFYYLIKLLKNKNLRFTIHYSLFNTLMLYSHYLTWLVLPVQWFYLLLEKKKNKKAIFAFSLSHSLTLSLYLPWLAVFTQQIQGGGKVELGSNWGRVLGGFSFKNLALLPVKFIIGRTSFNNQFFYFIVALALVLFFGFLVCRAMQKIFFPARLEDSEPGSESFLVFAWLGGPVLLGWLISLRIPLFSYFRFLFCLPAFYLLVSRGIFSFKKAGKLGLLALLVLLVNLFFSGKYLFNSNFHRENWRSAVKALHQQNVKAAPVLITEAVKAPFDFYDENKSKLVPVKQKETLSNQETVWLIPYAQPIFDPQDRTRAFLRSKGFIRTYEKHFRGVTLEKWQKPFG